MIGLIQRVSHARVEVDAQVIAQIDRGILALIGIEKQDNSQSAEKLSRRIIHYRIFPDDKGKMNLSLHDIAGETVTGASVHPTGRHPKRRPAQLQFGRPARDRTTPVPATCEFRPGDSRSGANRGFRRKYAGHSNERRSRDVLAAGLTYENYKNVPVVCPDFLAGFIALPLSAAELVSIDNVTLIDADLNDGDSFKVNGAGRELHLSPVLCRLP